MRRDPDIAIDRLAEVIIKTASQKKIILVLAESCTGGMIAAALTSVAGSSEVFDRGLVTYSNDAKEDLLGVPSKTLATYGAVSAETAVAMASGALFRTPVATLSASVTGIAGPGGGNKEKPVGLVHFACQKRGHDPILEQHIFTGNRNEIRKKASFYMLTMINNQL